jgi:hypothetical protein
MQRQCAQSIPTPSEPSTLLERAPAPCLFGGCPLLLWHLGEHASSGSDPRCAPRVEVRGTGRIVYWNVKDKDRKGHAGRVAPGQHAEVAPRRWVRVFGIDAGMAFDRVFATGDEAAYSGFNLTYTGRIEAIGNSTVTVRDDRSHRLSIFDFVFWNRRFNAQSALVRNRAILAQL